MNKFQSTLPMRGATGRARMTADRRVISIHAPHAGSDCGGRKMRRRDDISIHAPHAGSDLAALVDSAPDQLFQSTLPMRGATLWNVGNVGTM